MGFGDDPKEGCPTGEEVLPQYPDTIKCVDIENIEAAPAVHQHLHEARSTKDGVDDEQKMAWAGDMSWVVLVAKGDGDLRPTKASRRCPVRHVDPPQRVPREL